MNLADWSLRNRVTVLVFTFVLVGAGFSAFQGMSRLEDPEFTIKDALVITPYPGASAAEVEAEVSDKIELAAQQLGQLKEVESKSDRGLSTVTVRIKDQYDKSTLPQVWDELRRKVSDAQGELPPGAGPSIVVDDFGDVWGVFVAIYGPEYSEAELRELAKMLRRELLLVKDVAKIDFWGDRREVVYVEPARERLAQLGVSYEAIGRELHARNLVSDSGRVQVGPEYIAIEPSGLFASVEAMGELLITAESGNQLRLRDIAQIRRGYAEPAREILRYDGNRAIGIGISTVAGGNVVEMGKAIEARMQELRPQIQLGIEFGIVSLQSEAVVASIAGFTNSLIQAVAIVVVVLLLFMGLRSGLLIGFVLVLTIAGSFPFLSSMGVALERISLGALIIALGMLVDNAIVVVDGMLVRIQKGQDAGDAARQVVAQTALPLLGATAVAIMAFAAIGTSDDKTGEFCRSLFQVVSVSLGLSWVTAMTVTPVLGALILKTDGSVTDQTSDPYDTPFYRGYRGFVAACIRLRWLTVAAVLGIFAVSLIAFGRVDRSFFPDSTRPQFMLDFWLPQGTHIDETSRIAAEVERSLLGLEGTTHVSTLVGNGAMRFLLTYAPEKLNGAYAQFLIDVDDFSRIPELMERVERDLAESQPDALVYARRFIMGPGDGGKIQARFSGEEPDVLRALSEQAQAILHADGGAKGVRTDWRQRTKQLRPVIAEQAANSAGLTRSNVSTTLRAGFDGVQVGVYREADELLPIVVRAVEENRSRVDQIRNLQIWSPVAGAMIPLRQVVSGFETDFEDDIIMRLNRKPTLTIHADPVSGPASRLLERVRPQIEALELPPGYELAWWGEVKSSADSQAGLAASLPTFLGAMVLIVVALFNSLRQPAAIFLTVPLALIGVTWGLLATGQPFGFMALLGFLSLSGMLIKNAIVLIDEIEIQKGEGLPVLEAILTSGVSRLRPVSMAALTTALGMIPLLFDAFFVAMAITIIAGLAVATVLTMVVVPVLYAILFRVRAG
ncbi:MAG: efflux RND transporter permease subunit [Deltaproteobacteria bacterium]|nr:efflux RND transporter permease subunit [Deltaproteobacteria bacterium]MBW2359564.1 efflux RND transporter permease subunit [Deltaproteobacteria bacterium]